MLPWVCLAADLDSSVRGQLDLGAGPLLGLIPMLILPIQTLFYALALCENLGVFECFKQAAWAVGTDLKFMWSLPHPLSLPEMTFKLGRRAIEDELDYRLPR